MSLLSRIRCVFRQFFTKSRSWVAYSPLVILRSAGRVKLINLRTMVLAFFGAGVLFFRFTPGLLTAAGKKAPAEYLEAMRKLLDEVEKAG